MIKRKNQISVVMKIPMKLIRLVSPGMVWDLGPVVMPIHRSVKRSTGLDLEERIEMNAAQVNRRIQCFLRDLADEGTFRMRKNSGGHLLCVACFGGQKRHFTLCWTPGRNYQIYAVRNLNHFVRSLPLEGIQRFTLHKSYEDL